MPSNVDSASMAEIEEAKAAFKAYNDHLNEIEKAKAPQKLVSPDDPTNSKVTAVMAGIANPVGLADEIGAAGSTALNAISGMTGPLAGGTVQDLVDEYRSKRDANRAEFAKIESANPKTYAAGRFVGGVAAGGLAGGAPQTLLGASAQGATLGSLGGLGESQADLTRGEFQQAAIDTAKGAGAGAVGGAAGYGIGKGISSALNGNMSAGLKKLAEKNAVKATGATGKQISNFDENAGRELLDRKIVGFGDTPKNIADKAQKALDDAHGEMNSVMKMLDEHGVTANAENVVKELNSKISTLRKDPSQSDVVRKLTGIVEDIKATGDSNPIISAAENTKRGFGRIAKNWQDPEKGQAGKAAYLSYRDEVERAATEAQPDLAKVFIDGKKTHALLDPIQEAAERRANTLQQSPMGGLLDVSTAGAGFLKGGPLGAIVAPVARRVFSPRAASSVAVTADKIASLLAKSPESLGKFAPALQNAAQRGTRALAATNSMLQKDPQYVEMLNVASQSNDQNPIASTPPVVQELGTKREPAELKGEALWENKGAKKLGIDPSDVTSKNDKKLLIEASDLSPTSKRFLAIKQKLSGDYNVI